MDKVVRNHSQACGIFECEHNSVHAQGSLCKLSWCNTLKQMFVVCRFRNYQKVYFLNINNLKFSKMEAIEKLEKQLEAAVNKAQYCDDVAKDAGERQYWALARFARNESALARGEIRTLTCVINSFKPVN